MANPFSHYENQAQLAQGLFVLTVAVPAVSKSFKNRSFGLFFGSLAAVGYCVVCFVDYAIYAFSYNLREFSTVSSILSWIQLPLLCWAIVSWLQHAMRTLEPAFSLKKPFLIFGTALAIILALWFLLETFA